MEIVVISDAANVANSNEDDLQLDLIIDFQKWQIAAQRTRLQLPSIHYTN